MDTGYDMFCDGSGRQSFVQASGLEKPRVLTKIGLYPAAKAYAHCWVHTEELKVVGLNLQNAGHKFTTHRTMTMTMTLLNIVAHRLIDA